MFNNVVPKVKYNLRGIFQIGIPYEVRNKSGDWSPWFGQYEGQKHDDVDSNCCWAFAGNEVVEDTLEFLWTTSGMSKENSKWFLDNGYIDEDGDFYLSRRFIPIISGVKRNGNDEAEFWRLTKKYGAIPNKMLPYTTNAAYFDKDAITQEMYDLGLEFLKRMSVDYQEVGRRFDPKTIEELKEALKQSELQIGIPITNNPYSWNNKKIKWEGSKNPSHSVALYKIDEVADFDYPYFVYDQYNPMLKQLSHDYFIPLCTQGVVSQKKVQEQTVSLPVLLQFIHILQKIGLWTLGKVQGIIK